MEISSESEMNKVLFLKTSRNNKSEEGNMEDGDGAGDAIVSHLSAHKYCGLGCRQAASTQILE